MDYEKYFTDFDKLIDAEINPVVHLNLESQRIAKTEYKAHVKERTRHISKLAFADVPENVTIQMLPSRLVPFAHRMVKAIKHGKLDQLDGLLYSFWAELTSAVLHERQNGILKPVTPSSELERCKEVLAAKEYHSESSKVSSICSRRRANPRRGFSADRNLDPHRHARRHFRRLPLRQGYDAGAPGADVHARARD
jgi:hypothetical protein